MAGKGVPAYVRKLDEQLAESKKKADGLLALLQLALESQGGRMAISRSYDGRPKKPLQVLQYPDRIVLALGDALTEEEAGRTH